MKCPSCQFENPEGIKFCGGCGSKLELICPNCNYSNPHNFRFCGECGHNLNISITTPKEFSFDEKIAKLQKYLPKGIKKKSFHSEIRSRAKINKSQSCFAI